MIKYYKNIQNNVLLVIEMDYYLINMNGLVYFCNYNIIKQKHELTLSQRKKLTFASRIKYAEQKINNYCY